MYNEETANLHQCNMYLENAANYPAGSEAFIKQVPTLMGLFGWLSNHGQERNIALLSRLLEAYSPALEASFNHSVTASMIEKCIATTEGQGQSAYELCLIAYRAFWAIGAWDKAEQYIRRAVDLSRGRSALDRAMCLQLLGSLQINKGDFRDALISLDRSAALYNEAGEKNGGIAVLKEKAAYFLDKGDFAAAEKMYREAGDFELAAQAALSNHSLLMLGVVTRRQGKTEEALLFLEDLSRRARESGSKAEMAVSMHHTAWVHLNMQLYDQAIKEAEESQRLFQSINDPRGESDCDEQLGEIYQAMGNYPQSKFHYECCTNLRKQLENKQGLASVSRRLARLNIRQHKYIKGIFYLLRSCILYQKTGMLNKARLQRGFKEVFLRRDMASYPR